VIRKFLAYSSFMAVAAPLLLADFTYQETSTITGGAMASMLKIAGVFSKQAREPIQSTISVKGDLMVHRSATHASVIDLKSETITSIDMQKKQYSVMTFAEMKQAMEQMQERMEKASKKGSQKDNSDPQAQMKFKVSAKSTGNKKEVAGFEAKEMVLKMEMEGTDTKSGQSGAMVITTDMWVAPGIAGYREVREFYRRMGEKLNWTPGGNMFAANPQVSQGMAEVYKEVAKVDGVPVQQIITMGASGTAPAAADGSAPPPPPPDQQPQQQQSAGSALGSALGGRFGLGKKKPADSQQQSQSNGQASGSLLEMTTELGSFSSAPADSSLFTVPAGFKKVEPDMKRAR
jgi:hypothetical protein